MFVMIDCTKSLNDSASIKRAFSNDFYLTVLLVENTYVCLYFGRLTNCLKFIIYFIFIDESVRTRSMVAGKFLLLRMTFDFNYYK